MNREQISTYYNTARELVKANNPKAARAYVLQILNAALETYRHAPTALSKAKTAAFLDRWIAVSRDLYARGITEYVLQCFGLPCRSSRAASASGPAPSRGSSQRATSPKVAEKPAAPLPPSAPAASGAEIDIEGLLDETSKTQGWCSDVFDANKGAIVAIAATAPDRHGSAGTGFIISRNGFLLTNDHVVFDSQNGVYYPKVAMSFFGDRAQRYSLEVLFSDKKADLALCKFDPTQVKKAFSVVRRVKDYSTVKPGADCLVVGNAFDMGLAPFSGIIRFTKDPQGNLVYTAPSNSGDSGAPVFDRFGQCIGINKSQTTAVNGEEAHGYSNATPMDVIDVLLDKWATHNNLTL